MDDLKDPGRDEVGLKLTLSPVFFGKEQSLTSASQLSTALIN